MKFKDFKKVDVTPTHTVFKHHDGHLIHIANDKIPTSLRKEMRDIPSQTAMERLRESRKEKKMADGGEVEDPTKALMDEDSTAALEAEMARAQQMPLPGQAPYSLPVGARPRLSREGVPMPPSPLEAIITPREEGDKRSGKEIYAEKLKAYEEAKKSLQPQLQPGKAEEPAAPAYSNVPVEEEKKASAIPDEEAQRIDEAQAAADAAQETSMAGQGMLMGLPAYQDAQSATILKDLNTQLKTQEKLLKDIDADHDKEILKISKYMEENKVNPGRILGNMSTWDHIGQTIAFMLGGAGGALAGTENYAFKAFQNAVDRDIKAQEEDIDSQKNLLSAVEKKYKNKVDAVDATKAMMYKIGALRMQQLAAQSNSRVVAGKAAMMAPKFQEEAMKLQQQVAARRTQAQARQQFATGAPQSKEQVRAIIESIEQSDVRKRVATDLTDYTNGVAAFNDFKKKLEDMYEISRPGNRLLSPVQMQQRLKQDKALLIPALKNLSGENKFTDRDIPQIVDPFTAGTFTSRETLDAAIAKAKDAFMSKLAGAKSNLEMYNISVPQIIIPKKRGTIK